MKLTTGSLRSQDEVPSKTGKAAPASAGSLFPLEGIANTAAVEKILSQFPSLPAKVVLALAVANILSRSVTPQRLCACGCGAFVTGKAKTNGPACRKRLERERRRGAGPSGRKFNLVLQDEMPFKVPTVTDQAAPYPSAESAAPGPVTPSSKLALIRDLAQLGKTAEQISNATGCTAEMVAAYMKHLSRNENS